MDPSEIKRIEHEADPERCQGVNTRGQCVNKAVSGGTHCLVHGGNKQLQSQRKKSLNNYRLDRWNARIQRFTGSDKLKSLHDEIGILRMLLEEVLTQCHGPNDLVMRSQQISQLVLNIDKVVTSCHKLENSMGQLLDRSAVVEFAGKIIEIVAARVTDPNLLDEIASEIVDAAGLNSTSQ
jgi:hypothetical protein